MKRLTLPDELEAILLFFILLYPSYIRQEPLPGGLFDQPFALFQLALHAGVVILLIYYLLQKTGVPEEKGFYSPPRGKEVLGSLLGLGGLNLLLDRFLPLIFIPPVPAVYLTKAFMLIPYLPVALGVALMEELLFRGYFFQRFRGMGFSPPIALVCSSFLFAWGHLYAGPFSFISALLSAFYMGTLAKKGVSLFSLGISHGIFNYSLVFYYFLRPPGG